MPYVLKVIGDDGQVIGFLSEMDFEANGPNYPTGSAKVHQNIGLAMMFSSLPEAMIFVATRSKSCPTRPDGKPNRPLAALNFGIIHTNEVCNEKSHN